jgi:mono/diheme cytochrome c family protein
VVVSLTGSDRLAWVTHGGEDFQLRVLNTGLAPGGLASDGGLLAVAARLDDRIYLYDARHARADPVEVIVVDERPRESPRDLGERLFHGALLWSQSQHRPYSCNSCHWDGESDHRRHPGLLESRFEHTRPLGGVGAIAPIFTPGQSSSLLDAVDGFVRILDDRYFRDRHFHEGSIEVRVKDGRTLRIAPPQKRRALSAFLASVPVEPGPYLRTQDPVLRALITRGARLFLDDCADCHAPRAPGDAAVTSSTHALLAALERNPLVLGATGFAHTGPGPSFTARGNRIAPLMGLSRGGPYFSSGAAPTLRDVVAGFSRARPGVHSGAGSSAYDGAQAAALEAFLHTL